MSKYRYSIPYWMSLVLLMSVWGSQRTLGVVERVVQLNVTIALPGGKNVTSIFDSDESTLTKMGITAEDVANSIVYPDYKGTISEIVIKGRHIPLYLDVRRTLGSISFSYVTIDGREWSVSSRNYTNVTIEDFKEDQTLEPLKVDLNWTMSPLNVADATDITLISSLAHTAIDIDNDTVFQEQTEGRIPTGHWVMIIPKSGLYLRVINPHTSRITFAKYFNTEDYFVDKELVSTLKSLRRGRISILSSFYDASGRLGDTSRDALTSLGSFAAKHIKFRDCWGWAWHVGGSVLAEGLVTNRFGGFSLPRPLHLALQVPLSNLSERFCSNWPSEGGTWDKRRHFCDTYDGYGDLCSCEGTFTIPVNTTKLDTWREDLGVVVLAGNRPLYLYRLLRQLVLQPGIKQELVLVSIDGPVEEAIKVVEIFNLKYLVHKPEAFGSPRISRHLRFALFKALTVLEVDKFIVLEEDLILAPDFHSYMQQTSLLIDTDPTIYGVSAFSHFSYAHTASDHGRLHRVHSFPAYGWMVGRSFLLETLPKWTPAFVATDWDYWMGSGLIRRGRELVIPEVPRTAHGGLSGEHFSGLLTLRRFSNKPISKMPDARVNLTLVNKEVYEKEIMDMIKRGHPLNVTDPYNFTFPHEPGQVYVAYVRMSRPEDDAGIKILSDALGVWNQDGRDNHYGLWYFRYYEASMLIIGIPYSKYSKYKHPNYNTMIPTREYYQHMTDNFEDENYFISTHNYNDFISILGLEDQPLILSELDEEHKNRHKKGKEKDEEENEMEESLTRNKAFNMMSRERSKFSSLRDNNMLNSLREVPPVPVNAASTSSFSLASSVPETVPVTGFSDQTTDFRGDLVNSTTTESEDE